jgi:hypothetical protein
MAALIQHYTHVRNKEILFLLALLINVFKMKSMAKNNSSMAFVYFIFTTFLEKHTP